MSEEKLARRPADRADLDQFESAVRGDVRFAGQRGVFVPIDFLLLVPASLRAFAEASHEVMYSMGEMYGRSVAQGIRAAAESGFGVEPGRVFQEAMEYFTRSGWGLLSVKEVDEENRRVRVESPNLIGVERLAEPATGSPRPADDFTCGLVAGTASEAFGDDIAAHEEKCRAIGADTCVIVAGPEARSTAF